MYNHSLVLLLVCYHFSPSTRISAHTYWWQWTDFAHSLLPTTCMWVGAKQPVPWREGCTADTKYPPTNFGGVRSGRRQPCQKKIGWPKIVSQPAQLKKEHCPCLLEGRLTTNPILSALHLQSLNSNIYICMHFQVVSQQLIGISSRKWNHQWSMKLTCRSKTLLNPHQHWGCNFFWLSTWDCLYHSKLTLKLVCWFSMYIL